MTDFDVQLRNLLEPEAIKDNGFSEQLIARLATEQRRAFRLRSIAWFIATLAVVSIIIYFDLDRLITYSLTAPLYPLDKGWAALALAPINNAGALLVVMFQIFRLIRSGGVGPRVNL